MPAQRIVVVGHLGFESLRTPLAERRSLEPALQHHVQIPDAFDFSDVGDAHIATNLPQTQLEMMARVRALAPRASMSADCFDQFVIAYPKATCAWSRRPACCLPTRSSSS